MVNMDSFKQNPNKTFIADSAYAINYLEGDTLFLFADTLYAEQDSNEKRQQIRAYPDMRIFMTGMAGDRGFPGLSAG